MEEKRNLRGHTLNKNVLIQLDSSTQLQMGQQCQDPHCITNNQKTIYAMQDTKRNYGTVVTDTEHVNLRMQRKTKQSGIEPGSLLFLLSSFLSFCFFIVSN